MRHPYHLTLMVALVGFLLGPAIARALECPAMPEQARTERQADIKGGVAKLGPLTGAALETKLRSVSQDLLAVLPEAGPLYLQRMLFAAYCSALRDDRSLSEGEKGRRILEYLRLMGSMGLSESSRNEQPVSARTPDAPISSGNQNPSRRPQLRRPVR